ncbi:NUDIX pyrophosphatase [Bombiscardovia nodaiensis]|uniref:NUDIX pyrophosphatase n=1 Tax=Bombiscardovia nodaiensis TaxID=2932181 RepID=A0ABN6SCL6_9BIFI|nr:NUDIX pyrophosphatase [Bombiscardovia nodaiensis]
MSPKLDRLLLQENYGQGRQAPSWWITIGGGLEPGEQLAQAAARELWEETGIERPAASFHDRCIAERLARHCYPDRSSEHKEYYFYVVADPAQTISSSGFTPQEQEVTGRSQWWSRSQIASSAEVFWPSNLLDLWQLARLAALSSPDRIAPVRFKGNDYPPTSSPGTDPTS